MDSDDKNNKPVDPRVYGFTKAAYAVEETLHVLSIGRTSLYAAVKRGELTPVKFGKKTLFYATDLTSFLIKLRQLSRSATEDTTAKLEKGIQKGSSSTSDDRPEPNRTRSGR